MQRPSSHRKSFEKFLYCAAHRCLGRLPSTDQTRMDQKVVGPLLVLVSAATFLMVVHSTKHEAHMLLLNGRVYTLGADLPVAQSIAIRGNTIVAVGSSEDLRRQFDAVTGDHPVVLIRIDGHVIWVNSLAMRLARVSRETNDPPGGRIIRTPVGDPTGVFIDEARNIIESVVPPLTPEEIEQSILIAAAECAKAGLTEVQDMGIDSLR